jgi:hypothetical protein
MEHHNSGSSGDIFNGIFGWPILVVCSYSTESDSLIILLYFSIEVLGGVNTIVSVVGLDFDTRGVTLPIKS